MSGWGKGDSRMKVGEVGVIVIAGPWWEASSCRTGSDIQERGGQGCQDQTLMTPDGVNDGSRVTLMLVKQEAISGSSARVLFALQIQPILFLFNRRFKYFFYIISFQEASKFEVQCIIKPLSLLVYGSVIFGMG